MEPINTGSAGLYSPMSVKSQKPVEMPNQADLVNSVTKVEQNKVTLSSEGKALLAALQKVETSEKSTTEKPNAEKTASANATDSTKEKSFGDKVESFTYGALGMDSPDEVKEEKDSSYSAGQYLSGAATVGAILLALV